VDCLNSYYCQAKTQSLRNSTVTASVFTLKNQLCGQFDLQLVPDPQLVTLPCSKSFQTSWSHVPGNRFREESVALNQSRSSYPLVYTATLNFAFKIICVNIPYCIKLSSELCKLFHSVVCTVHAYHAIVYKLAQHYAHTYTVKLYLFIPAIFRRFGGGHYHHQGRKHPRPKKRRSFKLSVLSHIAILRVPLQHRAVYVTLPTC